MRLRGTSKRFFLTFFAFLFLLTGCETDSAILSNLDERDANLIVVFLENKGIPAKKMMVASGGGLGVGSGGAKFNIMVGESQAVSAMALLNQNGLPQKQGTNLLTLFAKQGLMTSDKEETIRYQAGLAQQIANIILMIDGVIDASVQLSFPQEETTGAPGAPEAEQERITAAVYVKHQGVIDDPNIHLENKIKRLISGSITGLDINDVTVVSDRSRFTDVSPMKVGEKITPRAKEYVSIWSIVMSEQSAGRFRFLFFFLMTLLILFALVAGWLVWKTYPLMRKKGFKDFLKPLPMMNKTPPEQPPSGGEPPPPGANL